MTLPEKVGQLFIFGFKGKSFNGQISSLIRDTLPRGVIVFSRNIQSARQIIKLNRALQDAAVKHSSIPLLVALDQEGGDVSRIRLSPPIPSALAIGQTEDETISERMGYLIGKMLISLGFNMNLAPVLDLSDPNHKSFIGTRSFGGEPKTVSQMTSAYAAGLDAAGVISTGKHFPGHGNLDTDSHKTLPIKNANLAELMTSDLMPFSLFMRQVKAPAIMVAHVSYPKIDPSRTPATFSRPILHGVLRKQLKYNGLVVTDDIEMVAAQGIGDFEQRAIRAINAGADLIMVAWSQRAQRQAIFAVTEAVKRGEISQTTLDDAVRRVLFSKAKYFSFKRPVRANLGTFRKILKSSYIKNLTDTILEKNFYSALSELSEDSFLWTNKPLVIIAPKRDFYENFKKHSTLPTTWAPFRGDSKKVVQRIKKVANAHILFYVTGPRSAAFANRFPKRFKARTFIVNATTPGLISRPGDFSGIINIYSPHPLAGKLVAENIIRKKKIVRRLATEASTIEMEGP